MAKISEYLKQILSARYGRDVRQSIHDAISAINDESEACWNNVENVPETLAIVAVKDRVKGRDISLPMSSEFVLTDFGAYGNTEQNTTSGKNLLNYSGLTTQTIGGITYTPVYDDKGLLQYVNANGTATIISSYDVKRYISANGQCILNGCPSGGSETTYRMDCYYSGTSNNDIGEGVTFEAIKEQLLTTRIVVWKGVTVSNLKFYPMIRLASITDGTYEPFTNGASPNPDYPQEIKSVEVSEIKTTNSDGSLENIITLSEPITLNGIGGVQDYIDVKRGVKVQKFGVAVFDGSDDEGWSAGGTATNGLSRFIVTVPNIKRPLDAYYVPHVLCTHYIATNPNDNYFAKQGISVGASSDVILIYDENFNTADVSLWKAHLQANPMTVVYELAEPIETPLSDADVEALKNIKTFKGITYLTTDSAVQPDLDVEYVIDTKMYIDSRFETLASATVNE